MRCTIHLSPPAGASASLFAKKLREMYAAWAAKHARNVEVAENRVSFDATDADAESLIAHEVGIHRIVWWTINGYRCSAFAGVWIEPSGIGTPRRHMRGTTQVRSYVLMPYQLCKQHVSGRETERAEDVLGGELGLVWGEAR